MKTPEPSRQTALAGLALDLALLAVASAYLLLPMWRGPASKAAVLVLYFVQAGLNVHASWKAGYLTKPLSRLHADIRTAGLPRRRPFEGPAQLLGLIAVGLVFLA